jgi:hypothetical protein
MTDLPTLPGLASELADLASLGGDMEADLADVITTLDGPDKAEPPSSSPQNMMFPNGCIMGKLELEIASLRRSLELCQTHVARLNRRL